jgi:endonuclease-3
MRDRDIHKIISILRQEVRKWPVPVVGAVAEETQSPFKVLVSCLLSLRTQDATTAGATARLFALAGTPEGMLQLPVRKIARTIYPVGFYRTKAKTIHAISRRLIAEFNGEVPDTIETLLTLKGVGRKTANLVVTLGYGKPGICVDTHVHRISNRIGYVKTQTPDETEAVLRAKLPRRYWMIYNDLLVPFGQRVCRPLSPYCSACRIAPHCDRVGVTRAR